MILKMARRRVIDMFFLLIVWVFPPVWTQDADDVTTIYKFDDMDNTSGRMYKANELSKWKISAGFIWTYNTMVDVPFPDEEYISGKIKEDILTEVLAINPEETFAITTNSTAINIYLMSSNDPKLGHIMAVNIMGDNTIEILTCNYGGEGKKTFLPGIGKRICLEKQKNFDSKFLTPGENFTLYFEHNQIVGSHYGLLSSLPSQYSKMKYVTMVTRNYEGLFSFRKPARVLALADSSGDLSSNLEYPEYNGSICLSLFYYMDQEGGGEITLLKGGNNNLIGKLDSLDQTGYWQTHRFLITFDDGRTDLRIHATKTSNAPLLIHSLRNCNEKDSWDSASFTKSGSVDIHARTNALGRPFHFQNGSIIDPNVDINIPSCPNAAENCEWVLNNWKQVEEYREEMEDAPLNLWHERINEVIVVDDTWEETTPFSGNINLVFRITNVVNYYNYDNSLKICIGQDRYKGSNCKLYIIIRRNSIQLYERNGYSCDTQISDPDRGSICVRSLCTETYNIENIFTESYTYRVTTEKNEHGTTVAVHNQEIGKMECTFSTEYNLFQDDTTYSMRLSSENLKASVIEKVSVNYLLSLEREGGSITSPLILPTSDEICVSLLYYKTGGTLNLGAELLNGSRIQLEEFQNTHVWKYMRVVKKLGRQPMRLMIQGWDSESGEFVTTDQQVRSKIFVQRIAGCHPDEDIAELGQEQNLQVFNPVLAKNAKQYLKTNSCKNGGLLHKQGHCICPPGFSGTSCEHACGSGKFGNDCNGRCSHSSRDCKGMIVCKQSWGCGCAPGYKGFFCSEGCEDDKYGSDCQQSCGKCATKSCDSFTGMCLEGCQEGYHPPMCQDKCSYFVIIPEVQRTGNKISITLSEPILGNGSPSYYQIQYKEEVHSPWQTIYSAPMKDILPSGTINITEPSPKNNYFIRGVIINDDACSYQGEEVPFVELKKNCKLPDPTMYHLATSDIGQHSFTMVWQPPVDNKDWCEVSHYEVFVKEGWKWSFYGKTTTTSLDIKERSPGERYLVKLRAVTAIGDITGFSKSIEVQTNIISVAAILNFRVSTSDSTQLSLMWDYPYSAKHFLITYQCVKLLGCPTEPCEHSKGHYQSYDTSATLRDLLPLAQYTVKISALAGTFGPSSVLQALTLPAGSKATPAAAEEPIKDRTNTSFTVQWAPPSNCSKLNGFQQGYWYRFRLAGEKQIITDGSTLQTSAFFNNLTPHTQYEVDIFVVTNGGWDENYPLTIPVSTRATTPERVSNLTVYKRSRREIGLRWGPPVQTYGVLQSFTISYTESALPLKPSSKTINPTPCLAWPNLYCFTVKKLRPGTEYSLSVQARNIEVPEDGDASFISARTQEGAPSAPSFIHMVSKDSTSLTIKWGIPWLLNGILRSFLVSVEEVDSHNSSDCCQYFPTREMPVNTEDSFYEIEVAGLRAASTYTISVSAKTVSFGPALNLTAHTKPPVPTTPSKPNIDIVDNEVTVQLTPIQEFQDLVRGYLLLLVPENQEGIPEATIWDNILAEDIKTAFENSFFIVGEYSQEELMANGTILLQDQERQSIGILGECSEFDLTSDSSYKAIVVAVLEYEGGFSFSYKESDAFIAP